MSLLSDNDLLYHTNTLGSGFSTLKVVENLVYSGLTNIVDSEDVQIERDLLIAYSIVDGNVNVNTTANLLRGAVVALQRHITSGSGQTFNDYLYVNELKVSQDFADLSSSLGTIIKTINVDV